MARRNYKAENAALIQELSDPNRPESMRQSTDDADLDALADQIAAQHKRGLSPKTAPLPAIPYMKGGADLDTLADQIAAQHKKIGGTIAPQQLAPASVAPYKRGQFGFFTIKKGADLDGLTPDARNTLQDVHSYLEQAGVKRGTITSGHRKPDGTRSHHHTGNAVDIVLDGDMAKHAEALKAQGFRVQYERKGQRNPNGSIATGDHIHITLNGRRPRLTSADPLRQWAAQEPVAPTAKQAQPAIDPLGQWPVAGKKSKAPYKPPAWQRSDAATAKEFQRLNHGQYYPDEFKAKAGKSFVEKAGDAYRRVTPPGVQKGLEFVAGFIPGVGTAQEVADVNKERERLIFSGDYPALPPIPAVDPRQRKQYIKEKNEVLSFLQNFPNQINPDGTVRRGKNGKPVSGVRPPKWTDWQRQLLPVLLEQQAIESKLHLRIATAATTEVASAPLEVLGGMGAGKLMERGLKNVAASGVTRAATQLASGAAGGALSGGPTQAAATAILGGTPKEIREAGIQGLKQGALFGLGGAALSQAPAAARGSLGALQKGKRSSPAIPDNSMGPRMTMADGTAVGLRELPVADLQRIATESGVQSDPAHMEAAQRSQEWLQKHQEWQAARQWQMPPEAMPAYEKQRTDPRNPIMRHFDVLNQSAKNEKQPPEARAMLDAAATEVRQTFIDGFRDRVLNDPMPPVAPPEVSIWRRLTDEQKRSLPREVQSALLYLDGANSSRVLDPATAPDFHLEGKTPAQQERQVDALFQQAQQKLESELRPLPTYADGVLQTPVAGEQALPPTVGPSAPETPVTGLRGDLTRVSPQAESLRQMEQTRRAATGELPQLPARAESVTPGARAQVPTQAAGLRQMRQTQRAGIDAAARPQAPKPRPGEVPTAYQLAEQRARERAQPVGALESSPKLRTQAEIVARRQGVPIAEPTRKQPKAQEPTAGNRPLPTSAEVVAKKTGAPIPKSRIPKVKPPTLEEVRAAREKVRELGRAPQEPAKQPAPFARGKRTAFKAAGKRYTGEWRVVELRDLVASHSATLAENAKYPRELQPRDRTRRQYEDQIANIVTHFDPEELGQSIHASSGAPIVGPDSVVESGNGRVIALTRVYDRHLDKVKAYRKFLMSQASQLGIDTAAAAKMKEPVLVRWRDEDIGTHDRVRFTQNANTAAIERLSPADQARTDANRLTPDVMRYYNPDESGDLASATNRMFIAEFAKTLPASERGALRTPEGAISQEGLRRIQSAVFYHAYGDAETLVRLAESTDDATKNVTKGMLIAAGQVSQLQDGIKAKTLYDRNIVPDLTAAANLYSKLRAQDMPIDAHIAQVGLFGDKTPPLQADILRWIEANKRSAKKISEGLSRYVSEVKRMGHPEQTSFFEREVLSTEELWQRAKQEPNANVEARAKASGLQVKQQAAMDADAGAANARRAKKGTAEAKPHMLKAETHEGEARVRSDERVDIQGPEHVNKRKGDCR